MVKLQYTGDGAFIMGVPACDLSEQDLENAACLFGTTVDETIELLIGRGLYTKEGSKHICDECGKEYISESAFHKHVLSHIQDEEVDQWPTG